MLSYIILLVLLFTGSFLTPFSSSEDIFLSKLIGTTTDNIFRGYKVVLIALHPWNDLIVIPKLTN